MKKDRKFLAIITFLVITSFTSFYSCIKNDPIQTEHKRLLEIENDFIRQVGYYGDFEEAYMILTKIRWQYIPYTEEEKTIVEEYKKIWEEKRLELSNKLEILKLEKQGAKANISSSLSSEQSLGEDGLNPASSVDTLGAKDVFNNRLLGLYVLQFENGNSKYFKFSKKAEDNSINIIYQDNTSGNVKIDVFSIRHYDESTNDVVLQNIKNTSEAVKVSFKSDPESTNSFKLIDSEGLTYSFVSI